VSTSMLDGKVGRIYMPRQDFEGLALRKMKVRHRTFFIWHRPGLQSHVSGVRQSSALCPAFGEIAGACGVPSCQAAVALTIPPGR